jgi:hypothetical protein
MRTSTNRFQAGIHAGAVTITAAGQATLHRLEQQQHQQPVRYNWAILRLGMNGPLIEDAEIIDQYQGLVEACQAATDLTRLEKAQGIQAVFLVQRHVEEEDGETQAAVEF